MPKTFTVVITCDRTEIYEVTAMSKEEAVALALDGEWDSELDTIHSNYEVESVK